jgi:predicted transcriptional regulator YheO
MIEFKEKKDNVKKTTNTARVLAKMFSPYIETVVHDLTKTGFPIIAIFNPQVTGRKIGDKTTVYGELEHQKKMPDEIINYTFVSPNNKTLKSSSITYKDSKGNPICALSINFDTSILEQTANNILDFISYQPPIKVSAEQISFLAISKEHVKAEIRKIKKYIGLGAKTLSNQDKKEIIKQMLKTGLITKRGVITILSHELSISRQTIYKYIKNLMSKTQN